jgi:hypothetical protein
VIWGFAISAFNALRAAFADFLVSATLRRSHNPQQNPVLSDTHLLQPSIQESKSIAPFAYFQV